MAPPADHRRDRRRVLRRPQDERSLADDVLDGLTRPFKELPPKHFYDATGPSCSTAICELPEYYPTRAERAILEQSSAEIVAATGAAELVELGSGTAAKTRLLLERDGRRGHAAPLRARRRHRVDGRAAAPTSSSTSTRGCACTASSATSSATCPTSRRPDGPRVVAFLGGTIGNFTPGSRRRFLRGDRQAAAPRDDHLLLGTDLVKDPAVLEAAYDDSAGVTAEFNRNVLRVVNRELDADFDVDAFEHVAFFDREREWIEMRLRAERRMDVHVGRLGLDVAFAPREELRTEISAKFTLKRLGADLAAAGLELRDVLTDPDELFALSLSARPAG